jgi:hypothetical protein
VLGYGLDDRGSRVRFPAGDLNFSLHHRVQNDSGVHPASYAMVTRGYFPWVKRPGREADHSPPSTADVTECVELYLHSSNTPSAWCLVKHRDNFTFMFIGRFLHPQPKDAPFRGDRYTLKMAPVKRLNNYNIAGYSTTYAVRILVNNCDKYAPESWFST